MKDERKTTQEKINKYEKEYVHYANFRFIKYLLIIFLGIFFVFLADFVLNICSKAFSVNKYFGYSAVAFCIFFICFVFIIPILKLFSANEFRLSVKRYGKEKLNKHNDKTCFSIAKSIIDFNNKLPEANWYDVSKVEELKIAYANKNIDDIRLILTDLINTSIRSNSNNIIVNYAVQAGVI